MTSGRVFGSPSAPIVASAAVAGVSKGHLACAEVGTDIGTNTGAPRA
jgi:hypothetical protein